MAFKKAERKQSKLRLALAGPSGSGKTLSALRIAKGMAEVLGCRIGVIDTEKESSSLYSGIVKGQLMPENWKVDFEILPFNPPFPPKKYVQGIKVAEEEGIGILIIDSASHAWAGEGGLLEMVDAFTAASNSKNAFSEGWKKATPEQNKLIAAILQSTMHIIITIRSKVTYEVQKGNDGKTRPVKIGLAPVQRGDLDYEFTSWLDLSVENHMAIAGKDRTNLFDGTPRVLTEATGVELIEWLNEGVENVAT